MENEVKEFFLTVRYIEPVSEDFDIEKFNLNEYEIDVKDGPDDEFGMSGNLAKACGFEDGQKIKVFFNENHQMIIEKI